MQFFIRSCGTRIGIFLAWYFACSSAFAQSDSLSETRTYSFLVMDRPAQLWTMRQYNENYLSGYRLYSNFLERNTKKQVAFLIRGISTLLTVPLSHEEGHRSILTYKNIGSISKPFSNVKGYAYVSGVRDSELRALRDNDLPNYIRLHTAGLESDYAISVKTEKLLTFEEESYVVVDAEYFYRKFSILSYYLASLIPSFSPNLVEEKDELKRDIVGHDIYGAIRHLHRPDMAFYRYTDYEDLTFNEIRFLRRVASRSVINLLNPQLLLKNNFSIGKQMKGNIGFGYWMLPFGDAIENNIWLWRGHAKILVQNRIFQNNVRRFYGVGIRLFDFPVSERSSVSVNADLWNQPEKLSFNLKSSFTGGAISLLTRYRMTGNETSNNKAFSIDAGFQYKTYGYMLEEVRIDPGFTFRAGISYHIATEKKSNK